MALETDLNVSPYFDDYNEKKDYYKILFRPGVAVQARELNQLQTMLQKQVERFGDNIFKRGTIVDGCNFHFYASYPYIKINDIQKNGVIAAPSLYVGYFVKSVNTDIGMLAHINNYDDGFESTAPDLKTLYISYVNAGKDGVTNAFSAGEVVSIFDPNYPVFGVDVNNGGVSFSNSDTVVVVPALVVNVSSGTFTNNEYLYQPITGANVQIIGIDTDTLSDKGQIILKVKPRTADLANGAANSNIWTVANSESVRNSGSTVTATVEDIIGVGASGIITTDSVGKIIDVVVTSQGSGYSTLPYTTVRSPNNSTGITNLSLEPRNYLANVQISSLAGAVGNGYAFGVSEGIIYQKGYFSRVTPQTIVVEKYSQSPNSVVVGFDTREDIVDSNVDTSLLDNALGSENENAPGANRLYLYPELVVMSSEAAAANDSFFVLTEWAEGRPYRQNPTTAYNKINDEMARRTSDESGDYVLNKFQVTTRSPADTSTEGSKFSVVVDPGHAYIDGYRVQTLTNYIVDVDKGNDVKTTNNQSITLNYENYVRIKEVGGIFQFNTGDTVDLYDSPKSYLTTVASAIGGTISSNGAKIGTARMRSMVYYDGTPGTNNAIYKLHMFDVKMLPGKNFRNTKSVFYNGTNKGVADIVLTTDSSGFVGAVLEGTQNDRLLFPSGVFSLKSSSNNYYTYRTLDQTLTVSRPNGTIVKDISSVLNEYFPYSGNVVDIDLKQILVVPLDKGMTSYATMSGNVSVNTTSANITGTATSFLTELNVGDYVYLSPNATANCVSRIQSIVNSTSIVLASTPTFQNSTHTKVSRYFPKGVPITLGYRSPGQVGHSANVDANGNILTVQFRYSNGTAMSFVGATPVAANVAVGVNIERRNVVPVTKTATRNQFVKIRIANNTTGYLKSSGMANGTIATTSGANTVTGTSTYFSRDFVAGEKVVVTSKILNNVSNANTAASYFYATEYYTIGTITDNTHMTFTTMVSTGSAAAVDQVVTKIGNLEGPWCLGVPDAFRLRNVYVGNSSVDNTFPNIVNDFFIDHNQTANYYDLSYLYKRNKTSSVLAATDYLLVEFDYGVSSSAGFFNTVSYTSEANAEAVAINDGLPLSNLTTKYNSFEVPEVYTKQGEYYDLLSTFDFRPRVQNSANPGSSPGAAPINPPYTVSFGTTSDPTNELMFPVPQSTFKTIVDQYMGRTDSVFVDSSGKVFVTKGIPAVDAGNAYPPPKPKNALLLNNILVAPYPNISKSSSATFAEIVNRRIANERLSTTRINNRVLVTPLTSRQIEEQQPTGYTMSDIGNIERRVSDLEYYVALSLLESDMKDRVIPSSIDPTINRFKYGFFVDDFSTSNYADTENPNYAATIEDDDVVPEREIWTTTHSGEPIICDYVDYLIISQDNATSGPAIVTPNDPPVPNCQPSTITANSWIVRKEITTKATVKGKEELDVVNVRMASVSAPVTMYAHFYSGADRLEIYQGNTLILQSNSAQLLSNTDMTKMKSNAVPSAWFNGVTFKNFTLQSETAPRKQSVRDSFKVNWTHNPANGLDYTIKVTKYTSIWRYALEYPINSNTVSCNTGTGNTNTGGNTVTVVVPPPAPTVYHGTMVVTPNNLDVTYFS